MFRFKNCCFCLPLYPAHNTFSRVVCNLISACKRTSEDDSFKEYGEAEIGVIANHFFPGSEDKTTKLLCQWSQVKLFLSGKKFQVPAGSQSSTFFMSFMLKNEGIFHPSIFEELLFVAEVGLSLPCSNA